VLTDLNVWRAHFEHHAWRPRHLPEELDDELTPDARHAIADSIATFQLGERSEGTHLIAAARRFAAGYAGAQADTLVLIVQLLVHEEHQHAALLGEFMRRHAIATKEADWSDWVFRRLRRLAGFELSVSVLMTAELIGVVYYRALEAASGCERLRTLCRVIVADELAHVGFEAELLLALQARRPAPVRALARLAHRLFFNVTALVVWLTHRPVLERAGQRRRTFLRLCRAQYAFHLAAPAVSPVRSTLAGRPHA